MSTYATFWARITRGFNAGGVGWVFHPTTGASNKRKRQIFSFSPHMAKPSSKKS